MLENLPGLLGSDTRKPAYEIRDLRTIFEIFEKRSDVRATKNS